jgi:P4 family phage/plasmid primase-like protien
MSLSTINMQKHSSNYHVSLSAGADLHKLETMIYGIRDIDTFLNIFRVPKQFDETPAQPSASSSSTTSSETIVSTHTGVGKHLGSFSIPNEYMDHFFVILGEAFQRDEAFHVIERPPSIPLSRMKWDFDFKYPIKRNDAGEPILERRHNLDTIQNIVRMINKEVHEFLNVEKDDLTCYIFERSNSYVNDKHMKDGFHLMYPTIVCKPEIQYAIRDSILTKIKPLIEHLEYTNTIADIVDNSVIDRNGWYMYGASKLGLEPYLMTYVLDVNGEVMDPEKDVQYPQYCMDEDDNIHLQKLFSIRLGLEEHVKECRDEKSDAVQKTIDKKKVYLNKKKSEHSSGPKMDISLVRRYAECLSKDRADNYQQWRDVIYVLHNMDPSSQELLEIAKDFSKKSEKYQEGCVEKLWGDAKQDGGLSIGSLVYWAKVDNYAMFTEINIDKMRVYVENSISGTNVDIANALYQLYKDDYKCVSARNSVWFEFKNHRWVEIDGNVSIRRKISEELFDVYSQRFESLTDELAETESEEQHEKLMKKIKALTDIQAKLKSTSFKENIMKESKDLFHDSEFYKRLDENIYLVGFNNGVLDLRTMEFRDGRPDDYITKSTGINYIPEEEMEQTIVEEIYDFFYELYGTQEIVDYMITMFASSLLGMNKEEKFRINIGGGGNGKSKITELLFLAFGDYAKKLPITLITRKRADSTVAQPAILELKGCRIGFFEETEERESFNVGIVKEMSGNDNITARGLYDKNIIKFKNQAKLFVNCNDLPKVPPYDEGMWRRLEVIEYKRSFVDNPDPSNPFEKKKDIHLLEKMKRWPETFMAILIHRGYHNYNKKGIQVPLEVLQFTKKYKDECDNFREFLDDLITFTGNKEHILFIDQMYEEFRYWFTSAMSGRTLPTKKDFTTYLKKRLGKGKIGGPNGKFVLHYTYTDGSSTLIDENGTIIQHANPKFSPGGSYSSGGGHGHAVALPPMSAPNSTTPSPVTNPSTKTLHLKKTGVKSPSSAF